MIKIQQISKKYDDYFALSGINLNIGSGEMVALVGENGAGKSTLMRLMCGYISPTDGHIFINGIDINENRLSALLHIGYVPEISALYGDMSVFDFLLWIAQIWNIKDTTTVIAEAAEKMQITDVLPQKIDTLSKGYKKRVEIASAILHKPDILILDEPTDGLDPNQKHHIRQFMKQYAEKNIVLVSTHVLEDVDGADRIVMLAKGKIIQDANLNDFKNISRSKSIAEAFRILSSHTE